MWNEGRSLPMATTLVNPPLTGRKANGHNPALDGLRGVAILMVMLFHFGMPGATAGFLGVTVFFTLSGFLITGLLANEWDRTNNVSLRRFYTRRALRLLPALCFLLIVWSPFRSPIEIAAAASYFTNWIISYNLVSSLEFGPFGHLWSLAVEEQFYLIWPIVLLAVRNHQM